MAVAAHGFAKVILVGDSTVGKTALFQAFQNKPFREEMVHTLSNSDFVSVEVNGQVLRLSLVATT